LKKINLEYNILSILFRECFFSFVADLSASINSSVREDDAIAAGESSGEYLKLAKKGGGHKG